MFLPEMIGESAAIAALRARAEAVLRWQSEGSERGPILIYGETGTGKKLLGHGLHRAGPRAHRPVVNVCFTALRSEEWPAASTMCCEAARGGTALVDGLDPNVERVVQPLLAMLQAAGVFVILVRATCERDVPRRFPTIRVPPLRERGGDVLLLADRLVTQFSERYDSIGRMLSDGARAALLGYIWPGNVRELANVIELAVMFCSSPVIAEDDLGHTGALRTR
jgi:two-component system response regulator AtoC